MAIDLELGRKQVKQMFEEETYWTSASSYDAVETKGFRNATAHGTRAAGFERVIDAALLLRAIEGVGRSALKRWTSVRKTIDHVCKKMYLTIEVRAEVEADGCRRWRGRSRKLKTKYGDV